jgi:hypothetical protein
MMKIRRSKDRGHAEHGWLDSHHTFSFANYYDPQFVGFRSLLVINEDRVEGGHGFGRHSHEDMEILSYVLEGGLKHEDSLGKGSVLKPGDVQVISAGTGIAHSEFNASKNETVHFLQIWIVPDEQKLKPTYQEKNFSAKEKTNVLKLIGSKGGRDGSLVLRQDVELFASILEAGQRLVHPVRQGSGVWLQLIYGALEVNGMVLTAGDGISMEDERELSVLAVGRAEFLLFDLAV